MKGKDWIVLILSIILISVLVQSKIEYDDLRGRHNALIQAADGRRCQMCNMSMFANGITYKNHTAVWVQSRASKYINRTDYHEGCHILVRNKRVHFCEEK